MVVPASITSITGLVLVINWVIKTVSRASERLLTVDRSPLKAFKIRARLLMLLEEDSLSMVPLMEEALLMNRDEVKG